MTSDVRFLIDLSLPSASFSQPVDFKCSIDILLSIFTSHFFDLAQWFSADLFVPYSTAFPFLPSHLFNGSGLLRVSRW